MPFLILKSIYIYINQWCYECSLGIYESLFICKNPTCVNIEKTLSSVICECVAWVHQIRRILQSIKCFIYLLSYYKNTKNIVHYNKQLWKAKSIKYITKTTGKNSGLNGI